METGRGARLNEFEKLFTSSPSVAGPTDKINIQVKTNTIVNEKKTLNELHFSSDRLFSAQRTACKTRSSSRGA